MKKPLLFILNLCIVALVAGWLSPLLPVQAEENDRGDCNITVIMDNKWHCSCDYMPYVEGTGKTCMKMICRRLPPDHYLNE